MVQVVLLLVWLQVFLHIILGEIIDGTLALIENKDIKIKELMKHIPGPDFPTGGVIIGKDIIKQGYNNGRGSFKIRGEVSSKLKKWQRKIGNYFNSISS